MDRLKAHEVNHYRAMQKSVTIAKDDADKYFAELMEMCKAEGKPAWCNPAMLLKELIGTASEERAFTAYRNYERNSAKFELFIMP